VDEQTKGAIGTISDVFAELVSLQRSNLEISQAITVMLIADEGHQKILDALQGLREDQANMTKKIDEILRLMEDNE